MSTQDPDVSNERLDVGMCRLLNKLYYLPSLRRRHLLRGNFVISHVSIDKLINRAIVLSMEPIVAATVLYPFVASPTP
jgi:hypothetical protein